MIVVAFVDSTSKIEVFDKGVIWTNSCLYAWKRKATVDPRSYQNDFALMNC